MAGSLAGGGHPNFTQTIEATKFENIAFDIRVAPASPTNSDGNIWTLSVVFLINNYGSYTITSINIPTTTTTVWAAVGLGRQMSPIRAALQTFQVRQPTPVTRRISSSRLGPAITPLWTTANQMSSGSMCKLMLTGQLSLTSATRFMSRNPIQICSEPNIFSRHHCRLRELW